MKSSVQTNNPPIDLYNPLKHGYKSKQIQKQEMGKSGYIRDKSLSNDNQQTYYNPKSKKLLVNVAGTHNISDWATDAYLALGHLKDTNRYKEAKDTLTKAKKKYGVQTATISGHSLGGGIANGIASGNDRVYNLDPAYTIGQKARPNVQNYRTRGDIVSTFAPARNTKTLRNPNIKTGIIPYDALKAHSVDNIKKQGIFLD
jgi:hypothetical protein